MLLEGREKVKQEEREGRREKGRQGGREGRKEEEREKARREGKGRHGKGMEERDAKLKFSVVCEKNPLKNFKQRCDIIKFLSSEKTTLARAWTARRRERTEAGGTGHARGHRSKLRKEGKI